MHPYLVQPWRMHLAVSSAVQEAGLELAWQSLNQLWRSVVSRVPHVLAALVVVLLFWLVGRSVRWVVQSAARRGHLEQELVELFGTAASVLVTTLGVLVAFVVIFPGFAPGDLVAGLGLTSVAVGFAFKDILQNFFAGIFILWRRPFHIGDQIRSGEHEGTVEEINMRSTRLITYDGERTILPNADVYTKPIHVRTARPIRRVRLLVSIHYAESIDQAREVIHQTLRETEGVVVDPGPWVYVSELASSSVDLAVYFWTGSQQANVLAVSDRVVTAIKQALDREGIEIPFPHRVLILREPAATEAAERALGSGGGGRA